MIISIINPKGGAGKTTISTNISRCLTLRNKQVLLVDSDPQGSARNWHVRTNGDLVEIVGLDRTTIDKDINKFKLHYDWIIVDGAPQLSEMAAKTIICSDVILIPVQPSPYDTRATQEFVELIKERQAIKDGYPKAAFVISRQIVNTKIGRGVRAILEEIGLPVFKTSTFQRVCYQEAAEKMTVFEWEGAIEARAEIENIVDELEEFIL